MNKIGENMRLIRNLRGISLGKLSKITGIPKSTIVSIEGGKTTKTANSNIEKIAKALQLDKDILVGGDTINKYTKKEDIESKFKIAVTEYLINKGYLFKMSIGDEFTNEEYLSMLDNVYEDIKNYVEYVTSKK